MSTKKLKSMLLATVGIGIVGVGVLVSGVFLYERDKATWTSGVEFQRSEVERLRRQETSLRPMLDELVPQHGNLSSEVEALRKTRDTLTVELQSLKALSSATETALATAKSQVEAAKQESKDLAGRNEQGRKEITDQQIKLASLNEQIRAAQSDLLTARETESKATATAKAAEREMKKIEDALADVTRRRNETEQTYQTALGAIKALDGTKTRLTADITNLTADITNLTTNLTAIKARIPDEEDKLRTAQGKRASAEQALKETTRDVEKAVVDLAKVRKTESETVVRIEALNEEIRQLDTRVRALTQSADETKRTASERRAEVGVIEGELQARREAATRALAERDALMGQIAELSKRNEVLTADVRTGEAKLKTLTEDIPRLKADADKATDVLTKIRGQVEVANTDLVNLKAQRDGMQSQSAELTKRNEVLSADVRAGESRLKALTDENARIMTDVVKATDALANLRAQGETENAKLAALRARRDVLAEDVRRLEAAITIQQPTNP